MRQFFTARMTPNITKPFDCLQSFRNFRPCFFKYLNSVM